MPGLPLVGRGFSIRVITLDQGRGPFTPSARSHVLQCWFVSPSANTLTMINNLDRETLSMLRND
ncbi:hypothetical protein BDFB_012788 [Asbolus verrucosus]|uniref:Uncharacterized protein n=1 Tax=Asbolus verrucosus TaxID=1661398 RepID=A0A482VK40_ASBVE|nr:hypothetical protein BDFB_012788 [Asbolus verrucosus]